ncbi:MAG: outer membrane beta-barrel protein, partial [Bacteroidota bacterium]
MKNLLKVISLCLLIPGIHLCSVGESHAQTTSNFTFGGFVDSYYAFDFNTPASRDRAYTTQPLRHNEFNLNFAFLDAKYTSEKVRARFALGTGTYMISNYAAEPDLLKNIFEANAGFNISGSWWLDGGIFASHIGFESAVSKDNWNYSRSLMADYSPYYESGVKVTGNITDELTGGFFILNGWQNIRENNDDKALGTQLQYKPTKDILLNWSSFIGNEIADTDSTSPSQLRIFNDFYAQIALTESFSV